MAKFFIAEQVHSKERHPHDFYATNPDDVEIICKLEDIKNKKVLEPCAGLGHMSEVLKKYNDVTTNDLMNYGYNTDYQDDFMTTDLFNSFSFDCVVMNPPFKYSDAFVLKALQIAPVVYVFQKLSMLEGIKRYQDIFSKGHLKKIYIYSYRTYCARGGDFSGKKATIIAYAWYVFDVSFSGSPQIKWITRQ